MAKSRTAWRKKHGDGYYFQSADLTRRMLEWYRQWLEALAVNRFRWVNLPDSCDERYLELCLFRNGCASMAPLGGDANLMYSGQMIMQDGPNFYENPTKWKVMGANGMTFDANIGSGVVVFDNRLRMPLMPHLNLAARRLAEAQRTLDLNMMHMRTPFLVKGPREKKLDIINLFKQIIGGEVGVLALDGIDQIDVDAIKTDVPSYVGDINDATKNLWNEVYRFLGLKAVDEKGERLIADEVAAQAEPNQLMALDPLEARRKAADDFNLLYPANPNGPVSVVWREDFASVNYNYLNNYEKMAAQEGGA